MLGLQSTHFPNPDPRTAGWFLTGNLWPLLSLICVYVYSVKVAGPKAMLGRKPFDIRTPVLVYNLFMILNCAYFLVEFVRLAYWHNGYNLLLQEVDMSYGWATMRLVTLSWYYYLLRIFEFTETIFFVLRKKFNQVSGLHVFHHCIIAWNMWICVTYGVQAQTVLVTCMNTLVHLIMYTYYFLSALGHWTQRFLWWKRYLTQVQLVQFVVLMIHNSLPLFFKGAFVREFSIILVIEGFIFFVWFAVFYLDTYRKGVMLFECHKTD
ncbi:very long chain fatty acid elongase 7-like [Ornithodoros turicata]|uniref:very long chain fatty acid elongase 7-like n=1 Tax=Ornithodoros turicata TaxID=34597 RepID=UPI003138F1D0